MRALADHERQATADDAYALRTRVETIRLADHATATRCVTVAEVVADDDGSLMATNEWVAAMVILDGPLARKVPAEAIDRDRERIDWPLIEANCYSSTKPAPAGTPPPTTSDSPTPTSPSP